MINSDQIHVAMTKTCGLVATLTCQSNTFNKNKCNRKSSGHILLHTFFLHVTNFLVICSDISKSE
jgi:hypothetical protein